MEKNKIQNVIKESKTINEVLIKLGMNTSSGGYKFFKKFINKNNIDISHFLTKNEVIKNQFIDGKLKKIKTEDIFVENSTTSRNVVKTRLIKEKLLEYKCKFCDNDGTWNGKKISLILDHINGVNNDNRLVNLRFLCPNCNATLDTHCKGAKGIEKQQLKNEKKIINKLKRKQDRLHLRKVNRPDYETLIKEIDELGYCGTGRKYGVSDNTIRKWIKRSRSTIGCAPEYESGG